ncbi:chromo domain-containing protein LHP1 [Punica granatum]|uniref:Chromo domain-containing protein n=2 Tax=Punica granatum TaxID=22663 RepID=A0A218XE95_PUNGR|nr:chromo domain-containing protein LHP1 [Punica granatum]OWM83263.1 hypothetical protein CDL15_Pgr012744 [Punica granatum]PKI48561.1 hypothetical protein CRG98_031043 [Punica granatum]
MKLGVKKRSTGAGEEEGGDPFEERDQVEEGEGGGEEEEEGEEEDESDDEGDAADADFDAQQEEDETERPKLDEGFYEIEAVRRKRVRKGEVQYLIKWRGWPETANTWEPLENLFSCTDVIDAFEESLRSGKHRSYRKRKRKHGVTHTQPRKKQNTQQQSSYSSRRVEDSIDDELLTSVPIKSSIPVDLPREVNLAINRPETVANGLESNVQQPVDTREEPEYDPKLSELMGSVRSNGADPEFRAKKLQNSEGNGLMNGVKSDSVELNPRGAKRRKSGSVKRFKQELASGQVDVENVGCGALEQGIENHDTTRVNSTSTKNDSSKNAPVITKIIKPIGFSSSGTDNDQNVSVTFVVMRSDGKEEVVDNSYLKANNPLLLIDFYEQHLRYNPTPP